MVRNKLRSECTAVSFWAGMSDRSLALHVVFKIFSLKIYPILLHATAIPARAFPLNEIKAADMADSTKLTAGWRESNQ